MSKTRRSLILLALLLLAATTARAQTVTLSWDPNTEPDISGYVVFYGTQSGVYTLSQSVGNVTTWTVNNLAAGSTYCFAVEAVNTSGLTSPLSTEVCTTIPSGSGGSGGSGGGGGGGTATGPARLTGLTASSTAFQPSVPVTWTATATGGPEPIEYRYWLFNQGTGVWSLLRDYSQAADLTWTPTQPGTFVVQVWARRSGVTTTYEDWKSSDTFAVVGSLPQVVSFTTDRTFPAVPGAAARMTAVATGGFGQTEYRFLLYSLYANTWTVVQEYGPSNTAVWTPTSPGRYALQVWVRNAGSTAPYEGYRTLSWLDVLNSLSITAITANVAPPVTRNTPITFTVAAGGGVGAVEYQYWLYDLNDNVWTLLRPYGPSNQLVWTPSDPGTYALQVWARTVGSTAAYDTWSTTAFFTIAAEPVQVTALQADKSFPLTLGNSVTFSASASGGNAALQYQFWLYDVTKNLWTLLQPYSASTQLTWTPAAAGNYYVQLWVRSEGSPAAFEAYQTTPLLRVSGSTAVVTGLAADKAFPLTVGTPVVWTATATGGAPLEYQFWVYNLSNASWTVVKPYGSGGNTATWTPTEAGTFGFSLWVREIGSAAPYEAWKNSGLFSVVK